MAQFVFTLTRDDVNMATRCFQFAKVAHEKGNEVFIFLMEDGTKWADTTRDFTQKGITGDCPNDYFPYLEENEITVGVCPPCAAARGIDERNFASNMMLDGAPHVLELVAEGKVFNF